MKKFLMILVLMLAMVVISACGITSHRNDEDFITSWTADLEFFRKVISEEQVRPFENLTEEEFNERVDQLLTEVKTITKDRLILELNRIMALIGDEESRVIDNSFTQGYLGVNIDEIDGKFYVLNASQSNKDLIYREITQVNGYPIEEIRDEFMKYIPSENEAWCRLMANSNLSLTHYYIALDYFDTYDEVVLTYIDNGEEKELQAHKAGILKTDFEIRNIINEYHHAYSHWIYDLPEYESSVEDDLMIFRINKTFNIDEVSMETQNEILEAYQDPGITKLVLDFRTNLDTNMNYLDFLKALIGSRADILEKGGIYYLINNRTFSGGVKAVASLHSLFGGHLVGEPTGGSPNGPTHLDYALFPNHQEILLLYCTEWENFDSDNTQSTALIPDVEISYTLENYQNGIDPVMEYVFED